MRNYKKRKSQKRNIARKRMDQLFRMAEAEAGKHNFIHANRYVKIARGLGTGHRIRPTRAQKILFCRRCGSFLLPGKNLRVRVQGGKIVQTCGSCNAVKRTPLKSTGKNRYPG